jgi:nucleotide-binding universal stress UspA family protein
MHVFNKILFPVDLSYASPQIAPYVSVMATKFEAEVHLLFVVRVFEHFASLHLPDATIKNIEAEVARGAQKKLQEFMEAFFMTDSCKVKVAFGDPAGEVSMGKRVLNGLFSEASPTGLLKSRQFLFLR